MDTRLRQVFRDHQQDPCPERLLKEMARAGITFSSIQENVLQKLRYIFLEELDYKSAAVAKENASQAHCGSDYYAFHLGSYMTRKFGSSLDADGDLDWKPVDPWTIENRKRQQDVLDCLPIKYLAQRASTTTILHIWLPSQQDIIDTGKLDDIRFVVNADVKDKADVIDTINEYFPNGWVVSNRIHESTSEPQLALYVRPKKTLSK